LRGDGDPVVLLLGFEAEALVRNPLHALPGGVDLGRLVVFVVAGGGLDHHLVRRAAADDGDAAHDEGDLHMGRAGGVRQRHGQPLAGGIGRERGGGRGQGEGQRGQPESLLGESHRCLLRRAGAVQPRARIKMSPLTVSHSRRDPPAPSRTAPPESRWRPCPSRAAAGGGVRAWKGKSVSTSPLSVWALSSAPKPGGKARSSSPLTVAKERSPGGTASKLASTSPLTVSARVAPRSPASFTAPLTLAASTRPWTPATSTRPPLTVRTSRSTSAGTVSVQSNSTS